MLFGRPARSTSRTLPSRESQPIALPSQLLTVCCQFVTLICVLVSVRQDGSGRPIMEVRMLKHILQLVNLKYAKKANVTPL